MKIGIIDFGLGNLFSIDQALKHLGADVTIVKNSESVREYDGLILPGVGAFGEAMESIKSLKFDLVLCEWVTQNKPLLGVCLGMQLLFEKSEEFGVFNGLGFIKGQVKRFPDSYNNHLLRIPHMGWETLGKTVEHEAWKGLPSVADLYFVHSFYVEPTDTNVVIGKTIYNGFEFVSAIASGNIWGMQFHPEKSGEAGLRIYKNWLNAIKRKHECTYQ